MRGTWLLMRRAINEVIRVPGAAIPGIAAPGTRMTSLIARRIRSHVPRISRRASS